MASLPKGSCILCGLASMYLTTTATDWTVVTPLGGQKSLPPTPYLRPSINPAQRPCSHICVPREPLHPGRMEFALFISSALAGIVSASRIVTAYRIMCDAPIQSELGSPSEPCW